MRYDEFINTVKDRAGLDLYEDALHATEATLETLGECLYRTEKEDLAAQLPGELKDMLYLQRPPAQSNKYYGNCPRLEEFYNLTSARMGVLRADGVRRTQAVLDVLRESVSNGEMRQVADKLPDEYQELLVKTT